MHRKYFLHAHPHSYVFTLEQEGQNWRKEFTSISDAVSYGCALPDSEEATITVFDPSGSRLAELRLREDRFAPV